MCLGDAGIIETDFVGKTAKVSSLLAIEMQVCDRSIYQFEVCNRVRLSPVVR